MWAVCDPQASARPLGLCCARPMRRSIVCILAVATLFSASTARADDDDKEEKDDQEEAVPKDLPRLFLDSGRAEPPAPEADTYRLFLHGEYQMRYQAQRSFPLVA